MSRPSRIVLACSHAAQPRGRRTLPTPTWAHTRSGPHPLGVDVISRTLVAPAARARDARMLMVADGLFDEFDVPVIMVVRALSNARRELHNAGVVPAPPELIGARARGLLLCAMAS